MKKIFTLKLFILSMAVISVFSCSKMEDNYQMYLDNQPYAPKVLNLSVTNHYKAVTLNWVLPESNRLEKIIIEYDNSSIETELLESYYIEGLDIKGYTFKVFTIDKYGYKSIPQSVFAFPSGEE